MLDVSKFQFYLDANDDNFNKCFDRIILNFQGKIPINASDLDLDSSNDFQSCQALLELSGLQRKNLLRQLFVKFNISFVNGELNKLLKDETIFLFFKVFDVNPKFSPNDISSSPVVIDNQESIITIDLMQIIFNNRGDILPADGIQASDRITIYDGLPISIIDNFLIQIPNSIDIFFGCVAIINSQTDTVAAVGKIIRGINDLLYLSFDSNFINFNEFKNQEKFNIALFPNSYSNLLSGLMTSDKADSSHLNIYLLENYSFSFSSLPTTNRPLCIDFGTSNSTAGSYGLLNDSDDINLVHFFDIVDGKTVLKDMLPTIVFVDSCQSDIILKFGFDAKRELINSDFNSPASFFFDLKRWINSMDVIEVIHDRFGNKSDISHRQIIKLYLEHIIQQAQLQFKVQFSNLHFSTPVKLKDNFLSQLISMFPNHIVMNSSDSLDEGMAVIYNYISNKMSKKDILNGKILILDCGGGTTDLADCSFSFHDSKIGKSLNIHSVFLNGDSNSVTIIKILYNHRK